MDVCRCLVNGHVMDAIDNAAFVSVGRACGFVGLAVMCIMLGLSFEPALAARAGGFLSLGFAVGLVAFALRAPSRRYDRTELWLILAKEHRPPAPIAQIVIGRALRDAYFWFAKQVVTIAIVLLATSVGLQILGVA